MQYIALKTCLMVHYYAYFNSIIQYGTKFWGVWIDKILKDQKRFLWMTVFSSWNSLCRADVTWECETMVTLSTTHLLTSAQKTALKPYFDVWKAVALQFYILHSDNCYDFNGQVICNFIQDILLDLKLISNSLYTA